eukprot:PhM_4_TR17261/c0_g1_i1/m.40110
MCFVFFHLLIFHFFPIGTKKKRQTKRQKKPKLIPPPFLYFYVSIFLALFAQLHQEVLVLCDRQLAVVIRVFLREHHVEVTLQHVLVQRRHSRPRRRLEDVAVRLHHHRGSGDRNHLGCRGHRSGGNGRGHRGGGLVVRLGLVEQLRHLLVGHGPATVRAGRRRATKVHPAIDAADVAVLAVDPRHGVLPVLPADLTVTVAIGGLDDVAQELLIGLVRRHRRGDVVQVRVRDLARLVHVEHFEGREDLALAVGRLRLLADKLAEALLVDGALALGVDVLHEGDDVGLREVGVPEALEGKLQLLVINVAAAVGVEELEGGVDVSVGHTDVNGCHFKRIKSQ